MPLSSNEPESIKKAGTPQCNDEQNRLAAHHSCMGIVPHSFSTVEALCDKTTAIAPVRRIKSAKANLADGGERDIGTGLPKWRQQGQVNKI